MKEAKICHYLPFYFRLIVNKKNLKKQLIGGAKICYGMKQLEWL